MTERSSPYASQQGRGDYLRPTPTDLGKGKTNKTEEDIIKELMLKRASRRNKFDGSLPHDVGSIA